MQKRNIFREFIETLAILDNFGKTQKPTDTVINDFINQISQIYGIPFTEEERQFLADVIKTSEKVADNVADIIHDYGYNALLLNEMVLYRQHKKTLEQLVFQAFLYGIGFSENCDEEL
jgi:hypothetical protein